jgi:hypothetical protein
MDHILQTKLQKYFRKFNILKSVTSGIRRDVNRIFALLEFNGSYLLTNNRRCVTSQKSKYVTLTLQIIPFCHYKLRLPLGLGKINDSSQRYAHFQRQEEERSSSMTSNENVSSSLKV